MIEYCGVCKSFDTANGSVAAVEDVSMRVETGTLCVLAGPSGSGKTTLLRMTNRLVEPSAGTIRIDGEDIMHTDAVALRRRIGYVIQEGGLFPHRTVAENVGTTLVLNGLRDRQKIAERVDRMLQMMNLRPEHYRDRYPHELSGGERQRAGVARALAADPPVLLMDEPFGAVDPINRAEIRQEFLELQRRLRKTIMFVSHDVAEALAVADVIALLNRGRLVQFGAPSQLLRAPADAFVRNFFGRDAALLLLSVETVADAMSPPTVQAGTAPVIAADDTLREALSLLLASCADRLRVVAPTGEHRGDLTLELIRNRVESSATNAEHRLK